MLTPLPPHFLITQISKLDYKNIVVLPDFTETQTQYLYSQVSLIFQPHNTYTSQSAQGRVGKFQFTAQQIEYLGFIKLGVSTAQQEVYNGKILNNTANWVGKSQCFSLSDFLNFIAVQNQSIHEWFIIIDNWLKNNTVFYRKCSVEDKAGYLMTTHLAGYAATIALYDYFLGKNTFGDPKNSQGYNLSSYFLVGSRAVTL